MMRALDISRLQITSPYVVVKQGDEYLFRTDSDIIIQRSHPQYEDILHVFDTEIAMFQEQKP